MNPHTEGRQTMQPAQHARTWEDNIKTDYKQIQTELRHYDLPQLFQLKVWTSSEIRGSHGPGFAKDLSSNMSGRVAGQIVPDVSKDVVAS